MTAFVILSVARAVGTEIVRSDTSSQVASAVFTVLQRHLAVAQPVLVPSQEAGDDTVFVTVEVADMQQAHRVAVSLRSISGVLSAFAKPAEGLP